MVIRKFVNSPFADSQSLMSKTPSPSKLRPPSKLKWLFLGGLILIVIVGIAAYFTGRSLRPYHIKGQQFEPVPAYDFTMISSRTQEPTSLSDFYGKKFTLIYFGYTTCPDVCPASLSAYSKSYDLLSKKAKDKVQFLWITVDPARDTPEKMEDYISHFRPNFMLGMIPRSAEELKEVANAYSAYYEKIDYGSEAGYLMDHSAGVVLVDPKGVKRLIYSFNTPPEDVASDLEYLIKTEME